MSIGCHGLSLLLGSFKWILVSTLDAITAAGIHLWATPLSFMRAARTPRSKGKRDGSLHVVKPVDLLAGQLNARKHRHDAKHNENKHRMLSGDNNAKTQFH